MMTYSECVYIRFFPGYPVKSLQTGESFFEFKRHLSFFNGEKCEKYASYIRNEHSNSALVLSGCTHMYEYFPTLESEQQKGRNWGGYCNYDDN
jgi:hypothetical protein